MELQDRQSYFRQTATGLAGFGFGIIVSMVDYMVDTEIGAPVVCILGGGLALSVGVLGWLFTRSLIK